MLIVEHHDHVVGDVEEFGANDSRSGAPELLPLDGDTLVLIGRVTPDDFGARADARTGVDKAAATSLNDLAKMRSLGGLYTLSYHSQLLARPDQVPVLARVARSIARDSTVWLATVGDVARWWPGSRCRRSDRGRGAAQSSPSPRRRHRSRGARDSHHQSCTIANRMLSGFITPSDPRVACHQYTSASCSGTP